MILSSKKRNEARDVLCRTAFATFASDAAVERVLDETLREFNRQTGEKPLAVPKCCVATERVKGEVKTFLPFLAMLLIGWAIQKLLDWLWSEYVTQAMVAAYHRQHE